MWPLAGGVGLAGPHAGGTLESQRSPLRCCYRRMLERSGVGPGCVVVGPHELSGVEGCLLLRHSGASLRSLRPVAGGGRAGGVYGVGGIGEDARGLQRRRPCLRWRAARRLAAGARAAGGHGRAWARSGAEHGPPRCGDVRAGRRGGPRCSTEVFRLSRAASAGRKNGVSVGSSLRTLAAALTACTAHIGISYSIFKSVSCALAP
mmetsp:Transcript_46451/g.148374  ORF Transcript_46451/g.148374 Transcript_46451/m.148374 type:complete len:205 (-) Transcript_46451:46-660(-)